MLIFHRKLAIPLPPAWMEDPENPSSVEKPVVGVRPMDGVFTPNVVLTSESGIDAYESIDSFAKRLFTPLQQVFAGFTDLTEGMTNALFPMFRREYTVTSTVKIRQVQYYVSHAGLFYSLTFSDHDDRRKQIAGIAAAMTTRIRFSNETV